MEKPCVTDRLHRAFNFWCRRRESAPDLPATVTCPSKFLSFRPLSASPAGLHELSTVYLVVRTPAESWCLFNFRLARHPRAIRQLSTITFPVFARQSWSQAEIVESVRESIAGRPRQPVGLRHWSPRTMDCRRRPLAPRLPLVLRNALAEMWDARCERSPSPP